MQPRWRVAVTRDESDSDRLTSELRRAGFDAVPCPVLIEAPARDASELRAAARDLATYDWAIFASRRAVEAVQRVGQSAWPSGLRTAAVGRRTRAALIAAGANPPPVVADEAGAVALWSALREADVWLGRRVLMPAAADGRRDLADRLRDAGAIVTVVEAYRMEPRAPEEIVRDWRSALPDAAVIASPRTARALHDAVGAAALASLRAVVAIGRSTHESLTSLGITATIPPDADFGSVARHLRTLWIEA
jgi:uroporphyrinogen-III synthase